MTKNELKALQEALLMLVKAVDAQGHNTAHFLNEIAPALSSQGHEISDHLFEGASSIFRFATELAQIAGLEVSEIAEAAGIPASNTVLH